MKKLLLLLLLLPLFSGAQIITTFAGSGPSAGTGGSGGYSGDGGLADTALLSVPQRVITDHTGNVYIADLENERVRKVDATGIITTIAGNGMEGFSGDGGPATAASFDGPSGLAFDDTGNLFISDDGNNRIRKVNTAGIISTFAGNGFGAGTVSGGYTGDGGLADTAELNHPEGIVADHSGNIYFCDFNNNVVRKVNSSGIITTIAGTGVAGYTGDGGPATAAKLSGPWGLCMDLSGNLYVVAGGVRKIDILSGIISTVAGNGTPGYSGDGGAATSAQISAYDVAVDNYGYMYIADGQNNRVRMVTPVGLIYTIAGKGTFGFSGDGGFADSAEMTNPHSVAVDAAGNIYIADFTNYRIRKVSPLSSMPISGASKICTGDTIILTDAAVGGTWTSSDTAIAKVDSGIVTGIAVGTATITYTVDTSYVMQVVTVNATPGAISGYTYPDFCFNWPNSLELTDYTSGGIWSSSDTGIGNIDSITGIVTAGDSVTMALQPTTFTYTLSTGCHVSALLFLGYCEGIPTIPNTNQISIFPNPAHDELTIQSSHDAINQILITNLLGQTVVSRQFSVGSLQCGVDVSGLSAGVYFVRVNGSMVKKFVKE